MDNKKINYLRNMKNSRLETYEDKHRDLIELIDRITRSDQATTLIVTNQISLGDNELEFVESLVRLREAEITLVIDNQEYHPAELTLTHIPWKGASGRQENH